MHEIGDRGSWIEDSGISELSFFESKINNRKSSIVNWLFSQCQIVFVQFNSRSDLENGSRLTLQKPSPLLFAQQYSKLAL